MAYSPQQIIQLVRSGKGPSGMENGGDQSAQLSTLHSQIADDMLQLQGAMAEHWQGDASGQAYAGAGPLVEASKVSGDHLLQAQNLYTGQGSSFRDLQSKVAAVGNLGDKPADDWVSNTPFSFLSNRSNEISAWNQKAQEVVGSYNTYHAQSTDNSGRWASPSMYGTLELPAAGGDIKPSSPGGPGQSARSTGVSTKSGSSDRNLVGGQSDRSGPGGVNRSGGSADTAPGSPGQPGAGGPGQGAGTFPAGGTTTAGYRPPGSSGGDFGGGGGYGPGFGPGGSGSGADSAYGPGGGFGPGTGFGPGGFGPGGSGTGSGAGSGAGGVGTGKGSGVGMPGGSGGPGAGSRLTSGPMGAPGRPGSAGMGGMGAAGRGAKGEGAEDSEHKTADYLIEADPDDALVGELPRTTPPVIGL